MWFGGVIFWSEIRENVCVTLRNYRQAWVIQKSAKLMVRLLIIVLSEQGCHKTGLRHDRRNFLPTKTKK